MASKTIRIKILIISCLSVLGLEALAATLLPGNMSLAGLGILRILQVSAVLGAIFTIDQNLSSIGLSAGQVRLGMQKGLIWSGLFGLITVAAFLLMFLLDINPFKILRMRLPNETDQIILFFVVGGVLAPITEEVFFRGILYGFFRKWGTLAALVFSTLLFVIAHPAASYVQIIGGIVFAVSYEKEKNLLVPIVIHSLGNCSLFSLSLFT